MISGRCQVRVRYSETDAMGVAHHSRHTAWFEVGRTELMRAAGYPYSSMEDNGLRLPVVGLEVRYRGASRYDDVLQVETAVEKHSAARISFSYRVLRAADGTLLATGRTEHALVNESFRPVRLPAALRHLLDGDEVYPSGGSPC